MLVLDRALLEKIVINNDIEITLLKISNNKVRLGFKAPENISIHRQEVFDRINKKIETHNENEKFKSSKRVVRKNTFKKAA